MTLKSGRPKLRVKGEREEIENGVPKLRRWRFPKLFLSGRLRLVAMVVLVGLNVVGGGVGWDITSALVDLWKLDGLGGPG